jgi:hypothetical protein
MRRTRELRDKATREEEMTQLAINTIRTLAIDAVQQVGPSIPVIQ